MQRLNINDAAVKDAQIKLSREKYASSMGQRSNNAALMDAQIKPLREECHEAWCKAQAMQQ